MKPCPEFELNNPLAGLVTGCGSLLLLLLGGVILGSCTDNSNIDINTRLRQTSEALNRQLPEMVDDEKILEATSGYNKQFIYYFTLVDYSVDDIDIEAFHNQLRPRHIEDVCTSETLQPFLMEGVTINYVYADKDRREFATIAVHPTDCEK